MDHGLAIRASTISLKVEFDLAAWLAPVHGLTVKVEDHKGVWLKMALNGARWSAEQPVGSQAGRKVAFAGTDQSKLPETASGVTNVTSNLRLTFHSVNYDRGAGCLARFLRCLSRDRFNRDVQTIYNHRRGPHLDG